MKRKANSNGVGFLVLQAFRGNQGVLGDSKGSDVLAIGAVISSMANKSSSPIGFGFSGAFSFSAGSYTFIFE